MTGHFTFEDYAEALKGAGPKTTKNLLDRAARDLNISIGDLVELENLADLNVRL